jgi:glutathione S-transferase
LKNTSFQGTIVSRIHRFKGIAMQLIGSTTSPYVRKVRIAMLEKNIACDFVNDPPWSADSHVSDYNPLGKVPALVTDDGAKLFDSNILIDYLELTAVAPALLPREPHALLQAKQIIALADGITDAGIAILLEGRRPQEKQHAEWVARQRGKIERGLAALEMIAQDKTSGQGKTWLHGHAFSAVDIAAGCLLFWLDFRITTLAWRAQYPTLRALAERLAARPSFQQTVPVE